MKRITMQGAADEDVARLRELLQRSAAGLDSHWKLYNGNETDLVVIDVDTVYGHMDWLRAHSSGRPVAVLTEHAQFSDADLVLHKPLDAEQLIEVLNRAGADIAERPDSDDGVVGATPPPAAAAPAGRSNGRATPAPAPVAAPAPIAAPAPPPAPEPPRERRLADWLADGVLSAPARLRSAGAADLIVDPAGKAFAADGNLRSLAPYCTRTIAPGEWQDAAGSEISALQDAGKLQPLARLVWLAHALGWGGQLGPGLDPNARYKLGKWPQIEREFPKHFRIATVMMKQPALMTEIAEQSGASLSDVADFINGYNAIGFVETDAPAAAPTQRDTGRGAILSRLRNPFG